MSEEQYWIPSPGEVVGGQYEIQSQFGEGGIVTVWEATDRTNGKTVAVKHIRFESDNYVRLPGEVENLFQREIEALRTVRSAGGHSNIIDLYDVISERETQFAVVEPIGGEELEDHRNALDPEEARRIVIDVADAMAFLHTNEIIYRDLKPDNAMLRGDGSAVLMDFNTAKEIDGDASAGLRCPACGVSVDVTDWQCENCGETFDESDETLLGGGGRFKPPETTTEKAQFRQGPWSDVYSLGKLLHELLVDTRAPKRDGRGPQDFNDDCPDYMHDIITRATAEDTGARYNNARVFKLVLENRDPEPPMSAELVHAETGASYEIQPGDTIGRQSSGGGEATITIDDPHDQNFISAVQVEFNTDENGDWVLKDRSLNGTYLHRGEGWERILCEGGRRRLRQKGRNPTDRHDNIPPEEGQLGDEALIKLVDPSYDVTFQFNRIL